MSVTDRAIETPLGNEETVRQALLGLRLHHHLSQKKVGEDMGETGYWYQERESGSTRMTADDLFHLADFFGVPTDILRLGKDAAIRWTLDHPDSPAARLAAESRSGSAVQESLFPIAA